MTNGLLVGTAAWPSASSANDSSASGATATAAKVRNLIGFIGRLFWIMFVLCCFGLQARCASPGRRLGDLRSRNDCAFTPLQKETQRNLTEIIEGMNKRGFWRALPTAAQTSLPR